MFELILTLYKAHPDPPIVIHSPGPLVIIQAISLQYNGQSHHHFLLHPW